MFNMPSKSYRYHEQRVAHERGFIQSLNLIRPRYNVFIGNTTERIMSDLPRFKAALQKAATDYLSRIQHSFFRDAGRERARKLLAILEKDKNHADMIGMLKEIIQEGNENSDSLKIFLYQNIVQNFCGGKINEFKEYPLRITATEFLNDVVNKLETLLVVQCIVDATELPVVVAKIVSTLSS